MASPFPNPRAGEFTHRINEVPDVGATIEFHDWRAQTFTAIVLLAAPGAPYNGIGDDRRLRIICGPARGMIVQPSTAMREWRYADG